MENDLYRHAGFLRGIARGLLREVHAADDVVHDAYASVLARGSRVQLHIRVPEGQGPPRLNVGAVSLDDAKDFRWINPPATPVVTLPGLGAGRWKLTAHVMPSIPERFTFEPEIEVDGEMDVELEFDLRR